MNRTERKWIHDDEGEELEFEFEDDDDEVWLRLKAFIYFNTENSYEIFSLGFRSYSRCVLPEQVKVFLFWSGIIYLRAVRTTAATKATPARAVKITAASVFATRAINQNHPPPPLPEMLGPLWWWLLGNMDLWKEGDLKNYWNALLPPRNLRGIHKTETKLLSFLPERDGSLLWLLLSPSYRSLFLCLSLESTGGGRDHIPYHM